MKHIKPRPRLNISLTAFPSTMLKTKFFLFLFEFTYVIGRLVCTYICPTIHSIQLQKIYYFVGVSFHKSFQSKMYVTLRHSRTIENCLPS